MGRFQWRKEQRLWSLSPGMLPCDWCSILKGLRRRAFFGCDVRHVDLPIPFMHGTDRAWNGSLAHASAVHRLLMAWIVASNLCVDTCSTDSLDARVDVNKEAVRNRCVCQRSIYVEVYVRMCLVSYSAWMLTQSRYIMREATWTFGGDYTAPRAYPSST